MDGSGFFAGHLGQAPGRPSGGGCQQKPQTLGLEYGADGPQKGGLAGPGPAGDDPDSMGTDPFEDLELFGREVNGKLLMHLRGNTPGLCLHRLNGNSQHCLEAPGQSLLLVVDALDEGAALQDEGSILRLLADNLHQLPPWLKVVIATRPVDIVLGHFPVVSWTWNQMQTGLRRM